MSSLINCESCKSELATTANNCPKCGAINNWQHPMLTKFFEDVEHEKVSFETSCRYVQPDRNTLMFYTNDTSLFNPKWHLTLWGVVTFICFLGMAINWAQWGLAAAWILGSITTLGFWIGLISWHAAFLIKTISGQFGDLPPGKRLKVDFSSDQIQFESNHSKYWDEIKSYFEKNQNRVAA